MNNYISCLVLLFVLAVGINAQADIDIDQLVLCSVLTQEERDILKRYPVIVEALAVVNRTPRYTQGSLFRNRVHSLKNITLSLLDIGDKEAAKVALRLTHKKFVDMPFMLQTDSFFKQLNRFYDHGEGRRSILSADDFYPQEFFDDLIARCSDDFSDKIYDGHYETGASRFREALRGVIYGMGVNPGRPYAPGSELEALKRKTGTLERGLNFITRIPDNKTCEGMRKELFLQLFRYIPLEMTTGFVDALAEPEIKKEFTAYLMEVGEQQKREDIYRNQTGHGNLRFGETPSREELQTLVDTTKNVFDRCEAMLALAMYDLKHGNIEQAVKQARELEKIFASVERPWQMGRTEMFFSELATALFKEGKYENGINYLLEGAGNFCAEHFADWSSTSSGETFILPPLQELYTAIRKDRTRDIIRKKLQVSLQSAKDFQTTAQSQQLRAILEMQIALGFEKDAIPVLKTTKFVEKSANAYLEPLWGGMTVAQFQLRCGLFDEAMETYSKITFRDRPNSSGRPETVDRVRFLQTLFVMSIARNKLDNAEKIIELVRPNVVKSFMLISLARAYQRAGDGEKALEIIDALIPPPVRVVLVSGLYKPDPTPETFPFIGYLALLDDLLHDEAGRKQNSKQVETLLDRYRAEIKKTANPQIRLERYSALISLLYWNDLRDSAMKIVEEIDSPHHAARVLLNIATDHETVADYRRQWLAEFYELDLQRFYAEYPERRLMEVYNSSYYYLDLAFAIKSAEGVEQQEAEKWERRRAPFEPDTAAMRMLLDKAAAVIEKETSPLNRASVLGAIGKMEYIYLEKENAKKRFNEALELLRSAKVEPGYSAAYQLARIFTELGEKDKALNAIKIDLFGNEPGKEIYANQKLSGNTESNLQLLEMLAQNGEAEFAAELFPRVYDVQHEYWRAGHVATIVVIALHHDSQNPKNPMLPKAQEQYQEYLRKLVRTVYQQQGELNKESALHNILLAWAAAENRIRSVQAQIAEKQASRSIADEYLTRRRGGYESPLFGEFELP